MRRFLMGWRRCKRVVSEWRGSAVEGGEREVYSYSGDLEWHGGPLWKWTQVELVRKRPKIWKSQSVPIERIENACSYSFLIL